MKFADMSDKQLVSYFNDNAKTWRKVLTKLTGFLRLMYDGVFKAFASEDGVTSRELGNGAEHVDTASGKVEIEMEKFDGPALAKIQRFIDELDTHNDLHNLSEYVAHLEKVGKRSPELQKIYVEAQRLHNNAAKAYRRSLKAAQEIAHDTLPDAVGAHFAHVQKYFKTEDAYYPSYGIVGVQGETVDFVQTTDISSMEHDGQQGQLSVVVTCRMEPTENEFKLTVYLNILDRLALPFRYNLGTQIKSSGIKEFRQQFNKLIKRELALHHVVSFAAPEKLNLDATEVENALMAIDGVSTVSFEDNAIVFDAAGSDRSVVGRVIRKLRSFKEISKMEKNGHHVNVTDAEGDGLFRFTMVRKL